MNQHYLFVLLPLAFILYTNSKAAEWGAGPDIPIRVRAANTSAYVGNGSANVYLVSGRDANDVVVKTMQRFNVTTSSWDTLAPHPTGLLGAATTVLKDSLYLIGGVINPPGVGEFLVWKYSINQNTWSNSASLPFRHADAKAVSYQDSLIYIAGGYTSSTFGLVYLYNAHTNSWRAATSIPSPTGLNFGGFAIKGDTLVYMCGTASFGSSTVYDSVYVGVINQSNRSQISWTRGRNFPGSTRSFFDACSWSDGIIMTGGSTDNTFNTSSRECYVYQPTANTWTRLADKPTAWLTGQSSSVRLPGNVWKLVCASGYGSTGYLSNTEILTDIVTGVDQNYNIPATPHLYQNYPNPFNPETQIRFAVRESGRVELAVFDLFGRTVKTLVQSTKTPGEYAVRWNGANNAGEAVSSGAYVYQLRQTFDGGSSQVSRRMLLLK